MQSEEARLHLRDAQGRVMSIAAIQKRLQVSESGGQIEVGPYLSDLCESLEATLIDGMRPHFAARQRRARRDCAEQAASIGLIVTELVINALKHAFATNDADCQICVAYETGDAGWRLSVRDNGRGVSSIVGEKHGSGLGTSIVESLAPSDERDGAGRNQRARLHRDDHAARFWLAAISPSPLLLRSVPPC
ncbi:MAG: sensor histidine kinase [Rhizomicrobium sp.]